MKKFPLVRSVVRSVLGAVVTLAVCLTAQAQTPVANLSGYAGATTAISGGTNKAMALTTNAFIRLDVPRQSGIALYCQYKFLNAPGSADATSIRIDLFRGIDATARETNKWTSWTVAGNSTTVQSEVTNITVGDIPYLWAQVCNVGTNSHATNLYLLYSGKK